jgi:hypothetical protein
VQFQFAGMRANSWSFPAVFRALPGRYIVCLTRRRRPAPAVRSALPQLSDYGAAGAKGGSCVPGADLSTRSMLCHCPVRAGEQVWRHGKAEICGSLAQCHPGTRNVDELNSLKGCAVVAVDCAMLQGLNFDDHLKRHHERRT